MQNELEEQWKACRKSTSTTKVRMFQSSGKNTWVVEKTKSHWSCFCASTGLRIILPKCKAWNACTSPQEVNVIYSPLGVSPTDTIQRQEVPELESDHEEANTCLLLHSRQAAGTHAEIIVKSPDTDVFVLCVAMQKTIDRKLYLMTGTGNRFRLIDVCAVSDVLGEGTCLCLPGFHAFTGIS